MCAVFCLVSCDHEHSYKNGVCSCGQKEPSQGLEIKLNSDGVTYGVTGIGTCTDTDIVIPSEYEGKPVTAIGDYAFSGKKELTSVEIPDSITYVGLNAFKDCTNVVELEGGIEYVGKWAVDYDYQVSMPVIRKDTVGIASSTFISAKFSRIDIPDSVLYVNNMAFARCTNLNSILLGKSVVKVGETAFDGCTALLTIKVSEENSVYKCVDGSLYSKDGVTLVRYATGKDVTDFTVPEGVKTIGKYAFADCTRLTNVYFPAGIKIIDNYAFKGCSNLRSVAMPESLYMICKGAFFGCNRLASAHFADDEGWYVAASRIEVAGTAIDFPSYQINAAYLVLLSEEGYFKNSDK